MNTLILTLLLCAVTFGQSNLLLLMSDGYLRETLAYEKRVETDGGIIINIALVDQAIKKAKADGIWDTCSAWISPNFGVKKDANDKVTKAYNLIGSDDFIQADTSKSPTWYADSINGTASFYFDGGDYMTCDALGAISSGDDPPITTFVVIKPTTLAGDERTLWSFGSAVSASYYVGLSIVDTSSSLANGLIRSYKRDTDLTSTSRYGVDTIFVGETLILTNRLNDSTYTYQDDIVDGVDAFDFASTTYAQFTIGASRKLTTIADWYIGNMQDVIVYDSRLNVDTCYEIQKNLFGTDYFAYMPVQTTDSSYVFYQKSTYPLSSKYLAISTRLDSNYLINSYNWALGDNSFENRRTQEYSFTTNSTLSEVINAGNWIKAFQVNGSAVFSGGGHGYEVLDSVSLLADGVNKTVGATANFKCKELKFYQSSAIYENGTTDTLATLIQNSTMTKTSINISIDVVWVHGTRMNTVYLGMFPIQRNNGSSQITDYAYGDSVTVDTITTVGFTGGVNTPNGSTSYHIWGATSNITADVTLTLDDRKTNYSSFISNSASYNKIYFDYCGDYTPTDGETWHVNVYYRIIDNN